LVILGIQLEIKDGVLFHQVFSWPFAKEMRILMVGLHAAGKTTILYELKLGEIGTTLPTIGILLLYCSSCCPQVNHSELRLWRRTIADGSGTLVSRLDYDAVDLFLHPLWINFQCVDTFKCFSLLVNAQDELREAVLLVFVNKQDLQNAMNAAEISDKLGLHSLRQHH
ncbi:ADP-ribosylation factor 1-like, partial [Castanea sativa]|uniref:ADP-ribosylation factor 1-like n=1 Tax=Castanea sativa TaxID=21020 RepID=UPI003F6495F7